MFTFHRVGWIDGDKEEISGWLCLIETEEQLQTYLEWKAGLIAGAWVDIKDSPEDKSGHCRTTLANAMKTMLQIKMEKEGKTRLSLVEAVNYMERTLTKTPIDIFLNDGSVYINSAGGCRTTHLRNDHKGADEVLFETCTRKDFVFPTGALQTVKISKWFGGPHFYISVDGRNVEMNGVSKWNTVEAAEQAMKKYIKRNKIQVK